MSKHNQLYPILRIITAAAIGVVSVQAAFPTVVATNTVNNTFWQTQKKGANFFRQHPASAKDWQDAKQVGIQFFRIPIDAYLGYPVKLNNITQEPLAKLTKSMNF